MTAAGLVAQLCFILTKIVLEIEINTLVESVLIIRDLKCCLHLISKRVPYVFLITLHLINIVQNIITIHRINIFELKFGLIHFADTCIRMLTWTNKDLYPNTLTWIKSEHS